MKCYKSDTRRERTHSRGEELFPGPCLCLPLPSDPVPAKVAPALTASDLRERSQFSCSFSPGRLGKENLETGTNLFPPELGLWRKSCLSGGVPVVDWDAACKVSEAALAPARGFGGGRSQLFKAILLPPNTLLCGKTKL